MLIFLYIFIIMEEIKTGIFKLNKDTLYDADEDVFVKLNNITNKIIDEIKTGLFKIGGNFYDADDDIFINLKGGDIGGKYKNPLEKAIKEVKENEKNKKWVIEKGPEEINKILKEREYLNNVINRLNVNLVDNAKTYDKNYKKTFEIMAPYKPVIKAADKLGYHKLISDSVGKSAMDNYKQYLIDNNIQYHRIDNPFRFPFFIPQQQLPQIEQPRQERIYPQSATVEEIEDVVDETVDKLVNDPEYIDILNKKQQSSKNVINISKELEKDKEEVKKLPEHLVYYKEEDIKEKEQKREEELTKLNIIEEKKKYLEGKTIKSVVGKKRKPRATKAEMEARRSKKVEIKKIPSPRLIIEVNKEYVDGLLNSDKLENLYRDLEEKTKYDESDNIIIKMYNQKVFNVNNIINTYNKIKDKRILTKSDEFIINIYKDLVKSKQIRGEGYANSVEELKKNMPRYTIHANTKKDKITIGSGRKRPKQRNNNILRRKKRRTARTIAKKKGY